MILVRPFNYLAVAVILLAGCSGGSDKQPTLYHVSGKLTRGNKPLARVTVTFSPASGQGGISSAGATDENGAFVLVAQNGKKGAVPGKHKVILNVAASNTSSTVNMSNPSTREQMEKSRQGSISTSSQGKPVETEAAPFPPEYSDPTRTPLEYEVKEGNNDFDIPIP